MKKLVALSMAAMMMAMITPIAAAETICCHVPVLSRENRKGGCGNAIALYINQNLAETLNFTARPGAGIIERVSGSR